MTLVETHIDRRNFMPLDELIALKAFTDLNVKQQRFLIAYCGAGLMTGTYAAVPAVEFGYGQRIKHPQIRAYQLLANRGVRKVLDLHFRRTELEVLLSDLQQAVHKSNRMGVGLTPAVTRALMAFEKYVGQEKKAAAEQAVAEAVEKGA